MDPLLRTVDDLQEYRRRALLLLMREISMTLWSMPWARGHERHLWRMVYEAAPAEYGTGVVEHRQLALLRYYASITNVWWTEHGQISLLEAESRFSQAPE